MIPVRIAKLTVLVQASRLSKVQKALLYQSSSRYSITLYSLSDLTIELMDFQVRTNLLRKAYSYDEQRIDEVNLPPPLRTRLTLEDLTANVSPILSRRSSPFFSFPSIIAKCFLPNFLRPR